MKSEICVYTGIEPGKKGAGNFVSYFLNQLNENNVKYNLLSYNTPDGLLVRISKKLGILKFIKPIYYTITQKLSKRNSKLRNQKVVLFHPQSIGLDICIDLIQSNKIYFYVLDNFLFCKKSYNYLENYNSCTLCIKDSNAHYNRGCEFFPNKQKQDTYELFLQTISDNIHKINFLTQNLNQSLLLKKKYGDDIIVHEVGMVINLEEKQVEKIKTKQYDFLYHNTLSESKGLLIFLELAQNMKNFTFAIPYAKSKVKRLIPNLIEYENVSYYDVTWNTGLLDILQACKIVVNPSLWSAPVEGALLKSIKFNGCVAVISADYSFAFELPEDSFVKLTPESPSHFSGKLQEVLENETLRRKYIKNSKQWLDIYLKTVKNNMNDYIKNNFLD